MNTVIIREDDSRVHRRRAPVHQLFPPDGLYRAPLAAAYEREVSPAAKDAMAQILSNSRMGVRGARPICQDTGIVTVFIKWGMDCRLTARAACNRSSTRASAKPISTPKTNCAPRSSPIRRSAA